MIPPCSTSDRRRSLVDTQYELFSVVLTDWLSMIPALGVGWRPTRTRTRSRRRVCIRSQSPLSRHVRQ
jgi:hypothetical protein